MSAGTLDITIEQGATWELALKWCLYDADNAPTYEGAPIDLTDYTARAQIRKKKRSEDTELVMSTENGMIVLGGALGLIQIHVTAEDTAALDFSTGVWDLEMVNTVGTEEVVRRLVEGTVTLSKEVTK